MHTWCVDYSFFILFCVLFFSSDFLRFPPLTLDVPAFFIFPPFSLPLQKAPPLWFFPPARDYPAGIFFVNLASSYPSARPSFFLGLFDAAPLAIFFRLFLFRFFLVSAHIAPLPFFGF